MRSVAGTEQSDVDNVHDSKFLVVPTHIDPKKSEIVDVPHIMRVIERNPHHPQMMYLDLRYSQYQIANAILNPNYFVGHSTNSLLIGTMVPCPWSQMVYAGSIEVHWGRGELDHLNRMFQQWVKSNGGIEIQMDLVVCTTPRDYERREKVCKKMGFEQIATRWRKTL